MLHPIGNLHNEKFVFSISFEFFMYNSITVKTFVKLKCASNI